MFKVFCRYLATANQEKAGLLVKDKILKKLNDKFGFNLIHAEVRNISWKKDEPKGSEKFLEVIVVTTEFESLLNSKRAEIVNNLLKDVTKGSEITYKLLTPSKWYDSNQRGLKLKEMYCEPPVLNGKLSDLIKNYPIKSNQQEVKS